jgi:hypothetical protein
MATLVAVAGVVGVTEDGGVAVGGTDGALLVDPPPPPPQAASTSTIARAQKFVTEILFFIVFPLFKTIFLGHNQAVA